MEFPSSPCSNRRRAWVKAFRNVYGALIRCRNSGCVPPFETLRPAPPVPPPGGSLAAWIWVVVALAIVVAAGVVVASRH